MVNTLEELQKELEASGSGEFKPTDNSGVLDDDVLSQLAKATSPESIGLRLRKDESEPKSDSVVPEHKLDTTPLPVSKVPPEPKSSSVTGNDWKGIHSMLNGDSVAAPSAPVNQEAAGNVMKIPASGQFVGNTASGEPDWNKLTHDLKWAQNDAMSRRNVDHLLATVTPDGRYKMDPGSYEAEVSNARLPLEMAQARQGWHKAQEPIDEKADNANSSSLRSQHAREAFQSFFGDTTKDIPNFNQWSAQDVNDFLSKPDLTLARIAKMGSHSALSSADPKKMAAGLRADYPEELKAVEARLPAGTKLEDLDAKTLEGMRQTLVKTRADTNNWGEGGLHDKSQVRASGRRVQEKLDESRAPDLNIDTASVDPKDPEAYSSVIDANLAKIENPSDRAVVRAIVYGRQPASTTARSGPGARLMGLVEQIDPTYDATRYETYKQGESALAKDKEVGALHTAQQHLDQTEKSLKNIAPELSNIPLVNRFKEEIAHHTGNPVFEPLITDLHVLAAEIAAAYGENTEAGRQAMQDLYDPSLTADQARARIKEQRILLEGKLDSKRRQYNMLAPRDTGMSSGAAEYLKGSGSDVPKTAMPLASKPIVPSNKPKKLGPEGSPVSTTDMGDGTSIRVYSNGFHEEVKN